MKWWGKSWSPRTIGAVTVIGLASVMATATESKELGSFKDWSAHLLNENKSKTCYLHAAPKSSTGKYKIRGDVYMLVTHRTSPKTRNEVSVTAGYTYKKGSAPTLTIDGKKFTLFTQGDTAWADEKNPDDKVVAAMRAGKKMVVGGTSSRGTVTTDSYSLSGFSAAHNAINKACGTK